MIDPRKSLSRESQENDGIFSAAKSIGVLGAAAFGGIRLVNNYTNVYRHASKVIQKRKDELAKKSKQISLLYSELDNTLAPSDREDVLKYMFSDKSKKAIEGMPVHDHLTGGEKERALYNIEEELADLQQEWSEEKARGAKIDWVPDDETMSTTIDDINERLADRNRPFVPKVLKDVDQYASRTNQHIEKAYPGFKKFMNNIKGMDWKAKQALHGWNVELTDDIGKKAKFFLPDHSSGFITVRGSRYRHVPRITIPGDVTSFVEGVLFGDTVMSQANGAIEGYLAAYKDRTAEVIEGMGTEESAAKRKIVLRELKRGVKKTVGGDIATDSEAEIIKTLFERTINVHTDEYIGDVHPASTLIKRYILPELEEAAEKSFTQEGQTTIAQILQRVTGKKIRIRSTAKKQFGWAGLMELFVPGTSEAATVKGKISTKSPFWTSPFMDYGKQSQQRIDWMRGKPTRGIALDYEMLKLDTSPTEMVKRMAVKLAALLGPAPRDALEQLAQITGESFPGRLANVGFWFNSWNKAPRGDLSRIGDGAAVFVSRETDPVIGVSRLNIDDFAGSNPRSYNILSRVEEGEKIYHSKRVMDTLKEIEKQIRENGRAKLKANRLIGFDPVSHEEIRLKEDSIVSYLHEKDGELKIHVMEDRPLTVGQKLTLGKAQIIKVVHQEDLKVMVGGELGEYIAAGNARVGAELLMDADLLSKYKGGGVGLGIMQKVMNDMAIMEKKRIVKVLKKDKKILENTGVISAEIEKSRNKLSKSLKTIAKQMLGEQAVERGIDTITIDDNFNVSVILKKGITTDDSMFFKLADVEKLIDQGQSYGDWKGLAEWAEKLEKRIEEVSGKDKFKLMDNVNNYQSMINDKGPAPVFLMAGKGDAEQLVFMNMKAPSLLHKESAFQKFKVATRHRTPIGYAGGFKMTIDHIRNASIMGLDHYVRYLQILRDYNVPYLQNKYAAAEGKVMQNLRFHKKGPNVMPADGGPTLKLKAKELIMDDDLVARLAKDYTETESLYGVLRFRATEENARNLIGEIGDDRLEDALLKGEFMDLEDLASRGKLGLRGNSLGITDKETMKRLMTAVNTRNSDELVYL